MSALDWLDRAFTLTRRGGHGFRGRAWLAGAPLAFLAVFVFYLERVEGVRSLRGVLALGLGLAWWWRTHFLGRACRLAYTRGTRGSGGLRGSMSRTCGPGAASGSLCSRGGLRGTTRGLRPAGGLRAACQGLGTPGNVH